MVNSLVVQIILNVNTLTGDKKAKDFSVYTIDVFDYAENNFNRTW